MSPFYGIRFRKLTCSGEAFVKAWRAPSSHSVLEPGEKPPERVVRRGNVRWSTPSRPVLGPRHVRPESLPDPPACRVCGRDDRGLESEAPRGRFALEAAAAAARPDEMPDLVKGDEVAHLAANRWDADLEPSLATAVAMPHADHDRTPPPVDPRDPVGDAEVVDMAIEGPRLHPPSVETTLEVIRPARCCENRRVPRHRSESEQHDSTSSQPSSRSSVPQARCSGRWGWTSSQTTIRARSRT